MICNVGNAISKVFFPITTFSEASNISLTWFLNNTWAWRLFLEKPSKGNVGSFETRGVFRVWFASQCATFQTLNSKPRVSSPFSLLSLISSVIKIYSLFSGIKAYFDNQFEKLNEERREKNIPTADHLLRFCSSAVGICSWSLMTHGWRRKIELLFLLGPTVEQPWTLPKKDEKKDESFFFFIFLWLWFVYLFCRPTAGQWKEK